MESKEKLETAQKELDDCRLLIQQHEAKMKSLTENLKEVRIFATKLFYFDAVCLIVLRTLERCYFALSPRRTLVFSGLSSLATGESPVEVQIFQSSPLP